MDNALINNRTNLEKAIKALSVINTATLIIKDDINFKIKELEVEKKKIYLRKEVDITNLKIELSTNKISQEEFTSKNNTIEINYQNEIKSIDDNITKLEEQKKDKYNFLEKKKKLNSQKASLVQKRINKKENQTRLSQLKNIAKQIGPSAIVIILSVLVNKQASRISKELVQCSNLVDITNNLIDSINDEKSLLIATTSRNNTLKVILSTEQKISKLKKALDVIVKIVDVLTIIVTAMQIIALVAPLPPVRTAAQTIVNKLQPILISLTIILNIFRLVVNNLLRDLLEIKARLKDINPLSGNINNDTIDSLYGKLGLIENLEYNGFRFVIKEENNPNFVVNGIKRRYATAINLDGNDVIKSDYSFTLDPTVLIEELKLVIDETNLKP